MATVSHGRRRPSRASSHSSSASSPERDLDDDVDSIMQHQNDSVSSLGVSLKEMELDHLAFEEKCRLSPISRLPPEILIAVFAKLSSSPSDLVHCVLTCKAWARNAIDLLWHRPLTNSWQNLMAVIQAARRPDGYFRYNELVKRLNLAGLNDSVADGTLLPLKDCKRIERLTLTDCKKLSDQSIVPLISGNHSLVAIDVTGLDDLTDLTISTIAQHCYRLQGLNVSKCRSITDKGLSLVAQSCRRLRRLKFNECSQLTDETVLAFAVSCPDIVEIDLQRCSLLTDTSITAIVTHQKQMRELRLAQCSRITDTAFSSLPAEAQYDALRILDLTDCNELGDLGLTKIIDAAPRLKNLVLAKCRRITDRGVLAITRLGKNLHYIHLGHCAQITDHGVSNLIEKCTRIRYIDLACCVSLTDRSVMLLASLQKLKRIGLVKCANITDASIKALAKPKYYAPTGAYYPSQLERLHLSYCTNLTINGIRAMLLNCPKLSHLSLTGVQEFLREDLLQYCRAAPTEFNDHQRDVFCVFSGRGVVDLRKHLAESYPSPVPSDAGSDQGETTPRPPQLYRIVQFGGVQAAAAAAAADGQLSTLQHQLASNPYTGHYFAPSVATPGTFNLPPPPPPHTTQHFGAAHVTSDGTVVASSSGIHVDDPHTESLLHFDPRTLIAAQDRTGVNDRPHADSQIQTLQAPGSSDQRDSPLDTDAHVASQRNSIDLVEDDSELLDAE